MNKLRLICLASGMLIVAGGLTGQEKKEPAKPETKSVSGKIKGILPSGWGKLGLTEDQKQKVYEIDAKYSAEIDFLTMKIVELKKDRYKKQLEVLSKEQVKQLEDNAKKKASGG